MKMFFKRKDGGQDSFVTGYWLIEWKSAFSVCLLHFNRNTRENFHSHAFNSISWVLNGGLEEEMVNGVVKLHFPSFKPVTTLRDTFHRVKGFGETWVLSFRGPWADTWYEYDANGKQVVTLTHGRKIVKNTYANITKNNTHTEVNFGPAQGNEEW